MTLRAAIIGFGLAGRVFHAPLITAEPAIDLTTIVTSNADRASQIRQDYPNVRIIGTVDELIGHASEIDLVVIAASTPQHLPLATRTINAGIPTVVDKPLAVHFADGKQLCALAEAAGVPLTVFHNRRWDGDFLTVKRLIDEGRLGEVHRFESRFEWISSRPRPQWKSETTGRDGGGVGYDLGSHLIDQAVQLFGPVAEVHGELDSRRPHAVNDDDSFIALHHENGVRSHLAMSSLVAQRGFRFRVLGSKAAYTKWGLDIQENQLAAGMSPLAAEFGVDGLSAHGLFGMDGSAQQLPTERGAYPEFYRQLAAALRGEGAVPVDARDALVGIELLEKLHRSDAS